MNNAIRLSAELITYFNSAYWGLDTSHGHHGFAAQFEADPRRFFARMLDETAELGLDGIELAPTPANWKAAKDAFGSAGEFGKELERRGLALSSSYAPGDTSISAAIRDPAMRRTAADEIGEHARFIVALGARLITHGSIPRAFFLDDERDQVPRWALERVADELNSLGAAAAHEGAAIALHTDAFSVCARVEDIAFLMEVTDPATVLLCPDAGHLVMDGSDPIAVLNRHIDRVPLMHWKDCSGQVDPTTLPGTGFDRHDKMLHSFRLLGDGKIDWQRWMQVLRDNSWTGWAIAELDMAEDPLDDLRRWLKTFHADLAPTYR